MTTTFIIVSSLALMGVALATFVWKWWAEKRKKRVLRTELGDTSITVSAIAHSVASSIDKIMQDPTTDPGLVQRLQPLSSQVKSLQTVAEAGMSTSMDMESGQVAVISDEFLKRIS